MLASLGYRPGPVDGLSGRKTITAVRAFQSDSQLTATGVIADELLVLLRMAVKVAGN